nr:MAG TPA: hypothetical protein [Caudoviricetes sp.]
MKLNRHFCKKMVALMECLCYVVFAATFWQQKISKPE